MYITNVLKMYCKWLFIKYIQYKNPVYNKSNKSIRDDTVLYVRFDSKFHFLSGIYRPVSFFVYLGTVMQNSFSCIYLSSFFHAVQTGRICFFTTRNIVNITLMKRHKVSVCMANTNKSGYFNCIVLKKMYIFVSVN
jgi:hypothetical protein